MSRYS
jgi:quercetin dioxygenase-like cupin family protein